MDKLDTLADQYLNFLLIEKGLSRQTLESYSRDLSRYLGFVRENGIDRISEADTALVLKHLITLRNEGLEASRGRDIWSP